MASTPPVITVPRAVERVRAAATLVRELARAVDPVTLSPREAEALARELGALDKVVTSLAVRCARRADGDRAGLLSAATGTAPGTARRLLDTAERLEKVPTLHDAVSAGEVSFEQAAVIASAAEAAPQSADHLLTTAREGSFPELRIEAARTLRRAAAEADLVERERASHRRRYCRIWRAATGGMRVQALVGVVDGARLVSALDKETDVRFAEAWAQGRREPRDRLAADALVRLVTGAACTSGAHVVVRVDADALRRGSVEGTEVCEIDGVGPVSLDAARELLPEGWLTMLVRDGVDVSTVTSTTRSVPRAVALALAERDPCCVVPGCGSTRHLEIDHWRLDFARRGPTELDNLCRLCTAHHALKSREGYRIVGGPGRWRWLPPARGSPSG